MMETVEALRDDALEWCEGKSALVRAPLFAYLAYAGVHHVVKKDAFDWFQPITLVFHEMGHICFSMLGHTLYVLGGTIMQLVVPVAAAAYLLFRQRDYFGVVVGGSWLSFSLWNVAVYVNDASRENLPLVSMGPGVPHHDWATLLTEWHLLNYDDTFAAMIRVAAFFVWVASMGLGAWLLFTMWRTRESVR